MKNQDIQRCEFILSKSGSEEKRCGYPVSGPTDVTWDGYSYSLYLCDSHVTRFKAALDLLNHPSVPPKSVDAAERLDESTHLDPPDEEETGDEADTVCNKCGKTIPDGRPRVAISKTIESAEVDPETGREEIEVVDAQVLLIFCGRCGNRFDTDALVRLAREIPPTSD